MSFLKKTAAALIVIALSAGCAFSKTAESADAYELVTADGVGAIENGNTASAKKMALIDLYRNAVEQAVGMRVEGLTQMSDFSSVTDKVFSQAQGMVHETKIINESVSGDEYRINARCKVSRAALDGILGPAIIDRMGNPRIVLLMTGPHANDNGGLRAGQEISQLFHRAGYMMLDSTQLSALNSEAMREELVRGNPEALRTVVSQCGADILLCATVTSSEYARQRIEGIAISAVQSTVQLRAISTQNANILADTVGDARAQGTSAKSAADKAMTAAAKNVCDNTIYALAYNLVNGRVGTLNGRTVTLVVDGLSFAEARRLKSDLENAEGVVSVFQRSFKGGRLECDAVVEKGADELAENLDSLGVEIADVTQDKVSGTRRGQ